MRDPVINSLIEMAEVDSERDLDITAPLFAAIKNPKPDNGRSPERITIAALARVTITCGSMPASHYSHWASYSGVSAAPSKP
jgi:hypothetical protein